VVSDVRCARPGGRLFSHEGALYRPAQNCSRLYGYGYNIQEVLTLSPTEYSEAMVHEVYPEWDKKVVATHTYNACDGLSMIDAMVVRPRYYWRHGH